MPRKPKLHDEKFDYIIVGSGAGGAPLASRLAREGFKVLVIEAGSNHTQRSAFDPANEISRVPLLHAASSEHPDLSWRFFVEHYTQFANGRQPNDIPADPKRHVPDHEQGENESHAGIFYPRAAGIGGCTIHNAMITIAGPESDWDEIASFLNDSSWNGRRMRAYFKKLECNEYFPAPDQARRGKISTCFRYAWDSFRFLINCRPDQTEGGHGFQGWLHTNVTDLTIGLRDRQLVKMIKAALKVSRRERLDNAWFWFRTFFHGNVWRSLDPNHTTTQADSPEGVVLIPLAIHGKSTTIHQNRESAFAMPGRRSSPRELLLETLALKPENLTIWTDCLVTRVMLRRDSDGGEPRAVGVELLRGKNLYRAHVKPSNEEGISEAVEVLDGGEVILCGGAFNTPQLLMLSGIGDPEELTKHSIKCEVPLTGVGKNLQDRYEVSVVSEMKRDFTLLDGGTFNVPDDPCEPDRHLRQWREEGTGLYTSNGAVLGIFKRSRPELPQPDLFIFGAPSDFRGYQVGYSQVRRHNLFSWIILKSHTGNRDGVIQLRSNDPRDTPLINFNYFGTASGLDSSSDPDVQAIAAGVSFVRKIADAARKVVHQEVHPGNGFTNQTAVNEWIRRDAWGHHACGTCRMGPKGDSNAVLDSRFRVRNVRSLRVVDASIFPKIPGYFIVANIYMASEKAADTIVEDRRANGLHDSPIYPAELQQLEAKEIEKRRAKTKWVDIKTSPDISQPLAAMLTTEHASEQDADTTKQNAKGDDGITSASLHKETTKLDNFNPLPINDDGTWSNDVSGLALSGGGIRSATHALGILQALARSHALRRFDFMSTVSGGGYIGSFLGRYYDRLRLSGRSNPGSTPPSDVVEHGLLADNSPAIEWLRSHGNYIAPNGRGDGRTNFAIFVRNLLSIHTVIGLVLFSVFGIANAIRFGFFDKVLAGYRLIDRGDMPIGHLVEALLGSWFSPWFILFELMLLFYVLPKMVGYWIVSQDEHETYKFVPLSILFLVVGILLIIAVSGGGLFEPFLIAIALLSSFVHVELTWLRGRSNEAAGGTGGIETQRLRTRNYLTYDLGLALAVSGIVLVFTAIDTIAFGLQEWKLQSNVTYAQAFASLGAAIMAVVPIIRWLAGFFREQDAVGSPSSLKRILKSGIIAGALAVVLFTLPLLFYSFASHAVYQGGGSLQIGMLVTLLTSIFCVIIAFPSAITFVNRSSIAQVYSARLARAYLGASNPLRHRPSGINVTEVINGDDVASIRDYRPQEASGPLHLINVTLNETIDQGSRQSKRDRHGLNMAVSCLGVSVGENWHGTWTDASRAGSEGAALSKLGIKPISNHADSRHPLVDQLDRPADRVESLSLRKWMAISGAAVDAGRGRMTSLGIALLFGMLNMRTGYWWDSGISSSDRVGWPRLNISRRFLYLVPRYFATQSLILFEWIARYPGPWERFWHLSDGGFFENLAAYELIRRRVPRIIVCDGGADPTFEFGDFAELVRKARIDFGARIDVLTNTELDSLAASNLIDPIARLCLGTLEDLKPRTATDKLGQAFSTKHAVLCWIHYPNVPDSTRSLMLFIKSTVNGDEPEDVRNYRLSHPDFPHESTGDQFFDETQWESYRKLGEHVASQLFQTDWFWRIPLSASVGGPP